MAKHMSGSSDKNKLAPGKTSSKRTSKKINERVLSNQQKVELVSEKPMPSEQKTSIRNKLKKSVVAPPAPIVYDLVSSAGSVNEGSAVTFTFTTSGPDGTFYWTNGGTTVAADFSDALNNGSFVTTAGTGSVVRTLANDLTTEGSETLILQARTGSVTGSIVASSSVVTVNDTSIAGISPNWTVGASGASFTTLSAALASPSVLDGHYIRVLPGTYTLSSLLNVNKQVYIGGTPGNKGDVIIQSASGSTDPVTLVQVSAPNVLLKDLTFKHRKTSNTSIETCIALTSASAGNNVRVSNFIMDSCRVEHVEFGLVVRGNDFKIANSEIAYVGPNNSTRRHVGLYGSSGSCFFSNNTFEDNTAAGVTGNTNIFYLTSTTGLVPQEKYTGTIVVEGSTWSSSTSKKPNQFFNMDNCQSDSTVNLMFKNNVMDEASLFVGLYGSTTNFGNIFGDITLQNNTCSNLHGGAPAGGKGMLSIVGGGSNITWRSSNLAAHIDGNTINNSTYRTDHSAVDGPRIGRQTAAIASFSANVDTSIPATPTAPSTPTLAAS